jgi:biopolymer transport protein ExbD
MAPVPRPAADINLTPMIDVLLVLLAISVLRCRLSRRQRWRSS